MTPWSARISQALFGKSQPEESDRDGQISASDEPRQTGPPSKAHPIAIQQQQKQSPQERKSDRIEISDSATSELASSSSKRRNLAALLSTSLDESNGSRTSSTSLNHNRASHGSIVPDRVSATQSPRGPLHSRSSSDGRARSSGDGRTGLDNTSSGASGLGSSISQGVKNLQERYASSKDASETFKSMRERDTASMPSRPTGARSSSESLSTHQSVDEQKETSSSPTLGIGGLEEQKGSDSHTVALVRVPDSLLKGEPMLKVTANKVMQRIFRIDADVGQILWESKKNTRVNLESIREVRVGESARSYRQSLSIAASHEPRWLSIIYQAAGAYKALHLIALSDASLVMWRDTLTAVQSERKLLMSGVDLIEKREQMWLRQHWKGSDSSKDSKLDFEEVVRLCRRLGVMSSRQDLKSRFDQADTSHRGFLDFEDFQRFVAFLKRRADIESIFETWTDSMENSERTMSKPAFGRFLQQAQAHTDISEDVVTGIFQRYCSQGRTALDYNSFTAFLMSADNSLVSDQCSLAQRKSCSRQTEKTYKQSRANAETAEELVAVSSQANATQDMTRPLSEYFISSSHNTYLVAGQLKGDSTIEGYIRALLQGARSVELDCWDGPNNEPQVTHGRTLTSKIPLRDVIHAIGKYAFVASPFPLILSFEIHTELPQQNVIADILKNTLGDKLLASPLVGHDSDILPSPHALMGKILVKAKNVLLSQTSSADPEAFVEKNVTSTTDTTGSESDNIRM